MAHADRLFVRNPFNTSEIWRIEGNTRRHVFIDEYNYYIGLLGEPIVNITAQWFTSIRLA
jgi:hypothetical protein